MCYCDNPIEFGPMMWSTTFIQWKGEERSLTLAYRPSNDPSYQRFIYLRKKKHDLDPAQPAD